MAQLKKIALLTGGGDVPGLNSAMKQVVARASAAGIEVVGFRRGWEGVINYRLDGDPAWNKQWLLPLGRLDVRTIDRTGGTFLHTSRVNPAKMREQDMPVHLRQPEQQYPANLTDIVLTNLEALEIDALIPIGGDDTLSFAGHLAAQGFRQVAIPKTMDNDVYGTDYCIGFGTAITRSVQLINDLRGPIGSHERLGLIELFGRNSGETSLIASYLADVHRAVISEVPFDIEKLAEMILRDKMDNPSHYAIMTISEGAEPTGGEIMETGETDAYGHRKLGGVGRWTAEKIEEITGHGIMYQQLGYMMRSGPPDSLDRMVALNYGNLAMDTLLAGRSGVMTALQEGKYTTVGLDYVNSGLKRVEVDRFYDVDEYRPRIQNVENLPMFLK